MNVVRSLDKLRSTTRRNSVLVLLTLILQIGIIITLWLQTWVILEWQRSLSNSRLREKPIGHFHRETLGLNPLSSEKTLLNIFEIRGPIGMLFVCSSAVPGSETSFSELSWSFGADQCASSEGFLVTFTPSGLEVIFCDYGFFTEYSRKGIHFVIPQPGPRKGSKSFREASTRKPGRSFATRWQPPSCFQDEPDSPCGGSGKIGYLFGNRRGPLVKFPLIGTLVKTLRHNLMMTRPQGILVALNPTDEGRIGTGRNTGRSQLERG